MTKARKKFDLGVQGQNGSEALREDAPVLSWPSGAAFTQPDYGWRKLAPDNASSLFERAPWSRRLRGRRANGAGEALRQNRRTDGGTGFPGQRSGDEPAGSTGHGYRRGHD